MHEAALGLRGPWTIGLDAVGVVESTGGVDSMAAQSILLMVVHLDHGPIDRKLREVRPSQAQELGIQIGEQAGVQEWIVAEVDSRNDVSDAIGNLLRLGEEVLRIAIEGQLPYAA
jgi:hypothetical protein